MSLPKPIAKMPLINPCAACSVRNRAICAVLNDRELEHMGRIARTIDLDTHQSVFFEGDEADNLFVLISGALKLYKLLPDGRRQITGFLFTGDFLGLAFNDVHQYTAEALSPSRLCRLPRARIEALLEELPKLGNRLLSLASTEMASAQDQMLLLGRKTAKERLASFLVQISERAAARGKSESLIRLPMSRGDIGDFLGLTVETVSRTVTKLKADGLIALHEGNVVELRDYDGLLEIAEGG